MWGTHHLTMVVMCDCDDQNLMQQHQKWQHCCQQHLKHINFYSHLQRMCKNTTYTPTTMACEACAAYVHKMMCVYIYMYTVNIYIYISGQIIIFHQPRFPWIKGISLTKPPFGVRSCEVAIIWPDIYIYIYFHFFIYSKLIQATFSGGSSIRSICATVRHLLCNLLADSTHFFTGKQSGCFQK